MGERLCLTRLFRPCCIPACILYTRVRVDGTPKWKEWLLAGVYYPPIHALMERTQLKHIQKLAERDAKERGETLDMAPVGT
jgi:hypothetical protein